MKPLRFGILLLVIVLAGAFPWLVPNPAVTTIAVLTLLYAAVAVAWNIFSGYTGYISLGHATFFGIGAYTLAIVCQGWQIPAGPLPFLLLPLCACAACACALAAGWVVLRVRRNTFVIVTIALFFSFQLLAFNLRDLTNGSIGMNLPTPSWNGEVFNLPFYAVSLALLLLALGVSWWVRSSRYGLGLRAIRDDEERAQGLGLRTGAYTLSAYVLSAAFTGVAGGIDAYFVGSIYPQFAFDPTFDVAITLACFVGGLLTLWARRRASLLQCLGFPCGVGMLLTGMASLARGAMMIWSSRKAKRWAAERLLDDLGLRGDETLLDVGCGRGVLLIGAAKRLPCGRAIGIDLWSQEDQGANSKQATLANAHAEGVAERVEVVDGDMRDLSFLPDACLDAVVASKSIHNLTEREARRQALAEIVRVLKPGGKLSLMDIFLVEEYAAVLRDGGVQDVRLSTAKCFAYPPLRTVTGRK